MNHKKILSVFVLLSGIASVLSAAPFVFGYNEDFSVKVSVPKTNSQIQKKAAKMDTTMTALELTEKMGNGINLGNTHEAYRGWKGAVNKNVKDYEKIWGQPVTNQDMFYAYKGAGFDSVRIPVAWTNMMDYEHGDYTINVKLLDRIEEVVNYALNADLYVIINDHWDGQWWGMFGSDDKAQRTEAIKLYKSMWIQIANRFKNYDEHLIFEGANEELGGRLNDDTALSKGKKGKLSEFELYEAVKKINQCFVDVVRGTGGNNKYRFLLIPGYDTDIGRTSIPEFTMPEDKVSNRLLISVHYYTPSTYCIINEDVSWGKNKESWGTKSDIFVMNDNFRKMKRFVDAGYGVIIGEYGVARSKNGKMKENTVDWMSTVLDQCDKYNYCPMLWDCNTFFKKNDPMGFDNEEMKQLYLNRRYKPEE